MEIRLAQPEDIPRISAIFEHLYAYNAGQQPQYYRRATEAGDYPRGIIESGDSDLLIVLDDVTVVGLLHIEEKTTTPFVSVIPRRFAEVVALFVDPTYRGQGIAENLVSEAKKWATARRIDSLELFILSENTDGARFYERLGFEVASSNLRLPLDSTGK